MSTPPPLDPSIYKDLEAHCGPGADLAAIERILWAAWSEALTPPLGEHPTPSPLPQRGLAQPAPALACEIDLLQALSWPCFIVEGGRVIRLNEAAYLFIEGERPPTPHTPDLSDILKPTLNTLEPQAKGWTTYEVLKGARQGLKVRGQLLPISGGRSLLIIEDIDHFAELNESLRKTSELLTSVISSSLNGIMALHSVRDDEGRIIDFRWTLVNDSALGMVPFDRETLLNSTLLTLMPGNLETGLFQAYTQVVETGEPYEIEQHYDHEDEGIRAWFKITAVKTGDGFAVTFSDMTPIRQTLEDLNHQKNLLDLFISHSPAAVAMFDKDMRYLMVSQRWLLEYGLEGQEIIGRSHYEIFPELGDVWKSIHRRCLEGATEYSEEEAVPRLDGKTDWIRWEIHPWYTDAKRQGGIIMFSEVITERRRYQKEILRSENRLRAFIDAVPAGLLAVDRSGIPQYANDAALKLLDRPYLLDDPIPFPFRQSIERSSGLMYPLHKLPLYRALLGESSTMTDLDLPHPDGTIPVELTARPIYDQSGQIDFAVAVFSDISERLKLDRIKSEFVSTVSHELRTPLTAIQGSLGLMLGTVMGDVPPPMQEMLSIAHRNSERLVLLINDILDMEKIQSGSLEFSFTSLMLDNEISQAMEDIAGFAQNMNVSLELLSPPTGIRILSDSSRLHQVLTNLLSNAIKFSTPGSSVGVCLAELGQAVKISVLDRGRGVDPAFVPQLFERFAQGDSSDSREKGGTGLGLSISQAIIHRLQGTIEYQPRPGGGSIFSATLPILTQRPGATTVTPSPPSPTLKPRPALPEEPPPRSKAQPSDNQVVVVIDTSKDRAQEMAALLRNSGFDPQLYGLPNRPPESGEGPRVDIVTLTSEHLKNLNDRKLIPEALTADAATKFASEAGTKKAAYSFLYVEDDESLQAMLRGHLQPLGHTHLASNLKTARALIKAQDFDLAILDRKLPDGDGLELIPLLNASSKGRTPIVVWSAFETPSSVIDIVTAALVKSRSTANSLVNVIRSLLDPIDENQGKPSL